MRNCLWLNLGNDTEARKHGHKQIENYISTLLHVTLASLHENTYMYFYQ